MRELTMPKDLNVLTPFFSHLDEPQGQNMYSSEWKPVKEKKKSRRIHAFLVNKEPLAKVAFETKQERNRYVVEKREEGHTLQTIADSLGLTRDH